MTFDGWFYLLFWGVILAFVGGARGWYQDKPPRRVLAVNENPSPPAQDCRYCGSRLHRSPCASCGAPADRDQLWAICPPAPPAPPPAPRVVRRIAK